MKRRGLIILAGGAVLAWPLAVHAQQPERLRRVGVVIPFPENDPSSQARVTAFAQALARLGWVEGKNIRIDYRFAAGDPALYRAYAAELVGLAPDAILASPTTAVAELRQLTHTIPIVAVYLVDPVGLGFVRSLARPGGNITGFSSFDAPMIGKWLQLLKEVAPSLTLLLALAPAAAFAGPAEDASALIDRWAAAFNSNDVDALVKLYAPDAIFLSSVNPSINEGTTAIREYYTPVRGSGRKVEIGERHMTVLSDVAVVSTGLYEFTGMRDGKPVANPARFTMVLVKRGADWMIVNHHSSQRPKPLQ